MGSVALVISGVGLLVFLFLGVARWPIPVPGAVESRGVSQSHPQSDLHRVEAISASAQRGASLRSDAVKPEILRTNLPLRLAATLIRDDRAESIAHVEDLLHATRYVLIEGDRLGEYEGVFVREIRRKRLLLDHRGVLEYLDLTRRDGIVTELDSRGDDPRPSPETVNYRRELAQRLRALSEVGREHNRARVDSALLNDAVVDTVYDGGRLVGVEIDDVVSGGFYDVVGIESGDVVTSVNDVDLDAGTSLATILFDLATGDPLNVEIERATSGTELITIEPQQYMAVLRERLAADAPDRESKRPNF